MWTAGAGALLATPSLIRADTPYKRVLNMQSLNSGEKLNIVYWADGDYLPAAIRRIDWFLRDLRENKSAPTDPRLLDLLWEIDSHTRSKNPIYTMSGYRTERTNAWLDARGNGVDPGSFHMRGMAIDITQDFHDPEEVYRVAKNSAAAAPASIRQKRPMRMSMSGPLTPGSIRRRAGRAATRNMTGCRPRPKRRQAENENAPEIVRSIFTITSDPIYPAINCAPLAVIVAPVTKLAFSSARNVTQWAISSALPRRPTGIVAMMPSSTFSGTAATMSVSI